MRIKNVIAYFHQNMLSIFSCNFLSKSKRKHQLNDCMKTCIANLFNVFMVINGPLCMEVGCNTVLILIYLLEIKNKI